MQKNGICEGEVVAYGTDGEGIIKIEGTTAFVPFCLVGERVSFKALKVKGNIAYGKLEKVLKPSAERVKAPCPVFGRCGGCQLQHMQYKAQLEFKRGLIEGALNKLGGITAKVSATVPCEKQYRYRNKLAIPVGEGEGGAELGFYAPHSHRIVPVNDCLIQSEWAAVIIEEVKKCANVLGFSSKLRHVVVREVGGKFIIALVVKELLDVQPLIAKLSERVENFTLLLNINAQDTNVIFSDKWQVCHGEGSFEAEECGIKYRAGANTFLQVNDGVRAKLYERVLKEAAEDGAVAIDLYSGGGMLTAMLAKSCGRAYGVEVVKEASDNADKLARENGLEGKMINICGKVEDELDGVFAATEGQRRVIVCDPPRKGMERSVVNKIALSGADKIILVSCNPATLARDLGILVGTLKEEDGQLVKCPPSEQNSAYEIKSITPFDMFPQTRHVETLVLLQRK